MPLEGCDVDFCNHCSGMWFDSSELTSTLNTSSFSKNPEQESFYSVKPTNMSCPKCHTRMVEVELMELNLRVEKCRKCNGLFLDKKEWQKARAATKYWANSPGKITEPPSKTLRKDDFVNITGDTGGEVFFQFLTGLPLEIDVKQKLFSPAVTGLIVINVLIALVSLFIGLNFISSFGLIPKDFLAGRHLYTLITSMFIHAGFWHLIGNMYFLFITGDDVEEEFGWLLFLLTYFFCGITGSLAQVAFSMDSVIPTVGASGAIAGIMSAYMALFPHRRFKVRWFYFFTYHVKFEFPAYIYIGFWILMQMILSATQSGVAWWAHIGGFFGGLIVAIFYYFFTRSESS